MVGVYILFYKAININTNCKKQVDIIRRQIINNLQRRIHILINVNRYSIRDTSFIKELEANRIKSIPIRKKKIKWLRRASCKQVMKYAHEIDLYLFSNTLYKEVFINFPIGTYLEEDKYDIQFKNDIEFIHFLNDESLSLITVKHKDIISSFFKKYSKKGLIHVF